MTRKETLVDKIVSLTIQKFPLALNASLCPQFEEGVDVEAVVRFVLSKRNAMERAQRRKNWCGNDGRDLQYTSGLLRPLSNKALEKIAHLKQREVWQRLRSKAYPFSQLNKETREKILHLPISWIREGALWQLNSRKPSILLLR